MTTPGRRHIYLDVVSVQMMAAEVMPASQLTVRRAMCMYIMYTAVVPGRSSGGHRNPEGFSKMIHNNCFSNILL